MGRSVENTRQLVDHSDQETVTVVEPGKRRTCGREYSGRIFVERTSCAAQLKEAVGTDGGDVFVERQVPRQHRRRLNRTSRRVSKSECRPSLYLVPVRVKSEFTARLLRHTVVYAEYCSRLYVFWLTVNVQLIVVVVNLKRRAVFYNDPPCIG